MELINIEYSEMEGKGGYWRMDNCSFSRKALLVGKNASGKSRTLRVIYGLARHMTGDLQATRSGTYNCTFSHEGRSYSYHCICDDGQVIHELLRIDNKILLERGPGGVGNIWAEKLNDGAGMLMDFQTPPPEFALAARRDQIQHSFLEPLHEWARMVRYYQFGSNIGKEAFVQFVKDGATVDEKNQAAVIGVLRNARRDFGDRFMSALKSDMADVGYFLTDIFVGPPTSVEFHGDLNGLVGLVVRERDIDCDIDQLAMSQGMFRVLSLLIHVNYFLLKGSGSCLLIDDIGEGLDFERSCQLISLLRRKAEDSKLQVIMSTNDRFVMNEVPLDEWVVVQRRGNTVSYRNNDNSREIFEDFKFTGLSNFSFFEMDVINNPIGAGE